VLGARNTARSRVTLEISPKANVQVRFLSFYFYCLRSQIFLFKALNSVTPNYGYFEGGETVIVSGGPFFNRADFTYTCMFDEQPADSTTINPANPSILTCVTPSRRRLIGDVQLRVLLNGDDISPLTPLSFTFFSKLKFYYFIVREFSAVHYCKIFFSLPKKRHKNQHRARKNIII